MESFEDEPCSCCRRSSTHVWRSFQQHFGPLLTWTSCSSGYRIRINKTWIFGNTHKRIHMSMKLLELEVFLKQCASTLWLFIQVIAEILPMQESSKLTSPSSYVRWYACMSFEVLDLGFLAMFLRFSRSFKFCLNGLNVSYQILELSLLFRQILVLLLQTSFECL